MAKKFGLLGYPLGHSFSKPYFSEKFKKLNLTDHSFVLFECKTLAEFQSMLDKEKDLQGFSVTIPHKETIIGLLDELDDTARQIGAVNCVRVSVKNGKKILKGYNTDAIGFKNSIRPFLEPQHNRALILGTGGAAKAVHYVLKNIGIDVWSVTRDKARCTSGNCFAYEELNEHVMKAFLLIINTTPLGMDHLPGRPPIPYDFLSPAHFCYDLVYNPPETEFLSAARQKGALVMNGLDMLYQQADAAWKIWNS
jgi:shikimate dehydrogenase